MVFNLRAVAAAIALTVASAHASAANLVVNGGFETGNLSGWSTLPASSGSLFGVGSTAHSGFYGAYFGATQALVDTIEQSVPTAAGSRYTLSFWVFNGGIGNDALIVSWGNEYLVYQIPVTFPGAWTLATFSVTSTAPNTVLRFSAFDSPAYVYLDDISVEPDNLIVNPSFESGDFAGWNTMAAGVGSLFGVSTTPRTGAYGAFFAAVSGQPDQIWQNVPTQSGGIYVLQFWAYNTGYRDDRLVVSWDGQVIFNGDPMPASNGGWAHFTFVLAASAATTELRFAGLDGPSYITIDDVYLAKPANPQCMQPGDADRNNTVNFADITAVLTYWNLSCAP